MRTSSDMPDHMVSPETGETLRRGTRPFPVTYKGETIVVDLPGYYGESDGDGVLVGDDMKAADEALRLLKERVDGVPTPDTIRRIRQKLRLSQRDAGRVFKVGENAFDKYERGLIQPSGPTVQLMALLDRHPDLLEELR
ncbi:type II toxin-antitoxin system MqsA family antitoxin [Aquibium oceanicum]|nr:type II toxin-antitoxin system MqsA family antitoxin [Aquibium oceanicum]